MVDGGLLSNFPIDSLDRTDGKKPRWPTFGVTLLPDLPSENEQVIPALRPLHLLGPPTLLEQVVTTILVGRDQAYLNQPWVSARTIRMTPPRSGSSTSISRSATNGSLYDKGQRAAEDFLSTWHWSDYVTRFR